MSIPFINLKKQYLDNKNNIDQAIHKVLDHGQYIMGPEVSELEEQLASFVGVKHALCCSSGTDALLLPLLTKNLNKSDAIFTTPFTFFASAEAISLAGGTPVFVDIDPKTYNMDPLCLERTIKETIVKGELTPKGVMPVDLFGLPADYDYINSIAENFGLFVIEDCAQAFAADHKGKKACNLAETAATSFYPAKPLGCYGDGGAVFTNNTELYHEILSLRVHGQAVSGDKYDNTRIGLNARMDTIQAAILLEKLKVYPQEIVKRNLIAETYTTNLKEHVITPYIPDDLGSVWAQYSIQVSDREKLKSDLTNAGIPSAVFYPTPIHLSEAYKHLNYNEGDFPVSERVSKRIISLPMHPYLELFEVKHIINTVIASVAK